MWFSPFIHLYLLFELKKKKKRKINRLISPVLFFFPTVVVSFIIFLLSILNEDVKSCTEKNTVAVRNATISEKFTLRLLQYLRSGLPKIKSGALLISFLLEQDKCPLFLLRSPSPWYTRPCSLQLHVHTPVPRLCVRPSWKDCNVRNQSRQKILKNGVTFLRFFAVNVCICLFFFSSCHCVL